MNQGKKRSALDIISNYQGDPVRIMEVCGTHTHEIFRLGIRNILPDSIELISGPGCPVCVTEVEFIDEAVMLALDKGCCICTFGDLIRVPGSNMSLADARAKGAFIKPVYTPQDALDYAISNPDIDVVFLAVGFETTTPSAALSVDLAAQKGVKNYSILTANKTMPSAYRALKGSADAYLFPGHVNAISGANSSKELVDEGISGVICGFTDKEILTAIAYTLVKLQEGKPFFKNCYPRVVTDEGSIPARKLVDKVMEKCDASWRGLGVINDSGMKLRDEYIEYDARRKYNLPKITGKTNPACRCGEVLQGKCKPNECPLYKKVCTPQSPVGACMVSNEGTCAAYYTYSV